MQTRYVHGERRRKARIGLLAAATALVAAILPAGAGATMVRPVEAHAVTPNVVTPQVLAPATHSSPTPAPSPPAAPSGAPSPSSAAAISLDAVSGVGASGSDATDADDEPEDPPGPPCERDCRQQRLDLYRSLYQAAWSRADDGDLAAQELAEDLVREARAIESEIKAESATANQKPAATHDNSAPSAAAPPQSADPAKSGDSSVDDTDDTDLGSWDLTEFWDLSATAAWVNSVVDSYNGGQSSAPASIATTGSSAEVDLSGIRDLFGLGSGSGAGGVMPDPKKLEAD